MKPRNHLIGGYRAGAKPPNAKHHRARRFKASELPKKVDLRPFLTEIEEQVGNSCVANAFAGAYEYLAQRGLGHAGDVSRLFIYYNARAEHGEEEDDCGTLMDSAIKALKKHGACHENYWPNDEAAITEVPPDEAYGHAANFKITAAEYVETDLDLWKHTLAEGYPIAFSLNTFDSFDDATGNRGRVPLPKKSDRVRDTHGWHAMLCVGYLDKDQMFIVRNSWGQEWGDQGYCYIPYKYVLHKDFNGHDSWIVKALSDLDFSKDVWQEEDDSYFAGDDSIQLFDFYVATEDVAGFAEALAALCLEYVTESDFYFDYEERAEKGVTYAEILNFDMTVDDPEQFLEDLNNLCQEWTEEGNFNFQVEGYENEGDDEPAGATLTLSNFYVYTQAGEKIAGKIDKLCAKYAVSDDAYGFEYEENEDDNGVYLEFTGFELTTADAEGFLAALEKLCGKVCDEGGYEWEAETAEAEE